MSRRGLFLWRYGEEVPEVVGTLMDSARIGSPIADCSCRIFLYRTVIDDRASKLPPHTHTAVLGDDKSRVYS